MKAQKFFGTMGFNRSHESLGNDSPKNTWVLDLRNLKRNLEASAQVLNHIMVLWVLPRPQVHRC